jgi:hypothetical protein
LEGNLKVFLEQKHDAIHTEVDAFFKTVGGNKAKLVEMAAGLKRRLESLPRQTALFPMPPSTASPAGAAALP